MFLWVHLNLIKYSTLDDNKIPLLLWETVAGLGNFKIGGKIIHAVKYADELVLLARKELCDRI
jgi:hypothetical protein